MKNVKTGKYILLLTGNFIL